MALSIWGKVLTEQGPYSSGELGTFAKKFTVDVGTVASVTANSTIEADFTVAGLEVGDVIVSINKPTHQAGLGIVNARVKAADTLSITYMNTTAAGIVPTDENYLVVAMRFNA